MRMIDADALKEIYTRNFDYENCIYDGSTVVGNVDEAPTVDAVPVRHGTWIECKAKNIITGEVRLVRKCSECGSGYFIYDFLNSVDEIPNYCPHCGTDMRGRKEE